MIILEVLPVTEDIFADFPEIQTTRLNLREIQLTDAERIYNLLSNDDVIKHDTFEKFTCVEDAEELIDLFGEAYLQKKAIFWGISLKTDDQLIGFCKSEIEIPKIRADFGYNLMPAYWNKGIMTEALNAVVDFTFTRLNVNRIEAAVSTKNEASLKVLEKVGFMKEGILRERSYWKGQSHDMVMLSLLKKDVQK